MISSGSIWFVGFSRILIFRASWLLFVYTHNYDFLTHNICFLIYLFICVIQFGKPEEVAARVVTAEVNRDGIFEVTLLNDPYEMDGAYILEYLSVGKRGNKHYYNKIFISRNQLYVLTAQAKQDDFSAQQEELKQTLASFKVV